MRHFKCSHQFQSESALYPIVLQLFVPPPNFLSSLPPSLPPSLALEYSFEVGLIHKLCSQIYSFANSWNITYLLISDKDDCGDRAHTDTHTYTMPIIDDTEQDNSHLWSYCGQSVHKRCTTVHTHQYVCQGRGVRHISVGLV